MLYFDFWFFMNTKKLILSCFGIGFLPLAPGTWASFLLLAAFLAIHYVWPEEIKFVVDVLQPPKLNIAKTAGIRQITVNLNIIFPFKNMVDLAAG